MDTRVVTDKHVSRRQFLALNAGAATAALLDGSPASAAAPARQVAALGSGGLRSGHNILFVFTDQERYFPRWPAGLSLPGHERLQRTGVTFRNHYCPAVMCTSSRAVLVTGLQTTESGMFENVDVPWMKPLSTGIPTIGHMLRKAGYYTAYKGKWHLNRTFDVAEPDRLFTAEMEEYGFADYFSPGDIIGHTLGGYQFDHLIAGSAVTWLRRRGRPLNDEGRPWCLFTSLVNPHDIMYFNTDRPGENVQDSGRLMLRAARAPDHAFYKTDWNVEVPANLTQPLDAPGRPPAHGEFLKLWDYALGHIPLEEERWRRFNNYYVNCIRAVDAQLAQILQELDALGLANRTIIVFTSDHGEAAGAHGLHGKGPFAYQEGIHLPMYVVHPDVSGGQDCSALTGHIDMVPSLLAMAGVSRENVGEFAGRDLPGKDLTSVLGDPGGAGPHAVREAILFTYSGLMTNDSEIVRITADAIAAGQNPKEAAQKMGYRPDFAKRGSLRSVYDGRYKFTRYFAPVQRNRPGSIEELYKWNDVELYDLASDPDEMINLATDRDVNRDLILAMNAKLERLIAAEMGADDGRELPDFPGIVWTIDRLDL